MITKERLEELIKQGATIYVECWGKIKELNLNDVEYMEVEDDDVYYEIADNTARTTNLEHLFETQEEAEWHKEFGDITRTETLKLPTWEEFDKKGYFEFVSAEGSQFVLEKTLTVDCDKEPISYYVLEILINDYNHTPLFEADYTKENYTLACRKCKELFLGGEDE